MRRSSGRRPGRAPRRAQRELGAGRAEVGQAHPAGDVLAEVDEQRRRPAAARPTTGRSSSTRRTGGRRRDDRDVDVAARPAPSRRVERRLVHGRVEAAGGPRAGRRSGRPRVMCDGAVRQPRRCRRDRQPVPSAASSCSAQGRVGAELVGRTRSPTWPRYQPSASSTGQPCRPGPASGAHVVGLVLHPGAVLRVAGRQLARRRPGRRRGRPRTCPSAVSVERAASGRAGTSTTVRSQYAGRCPFGSAPVRCGPIHASDQSSVQQAAVELTGVAPAARPASVQHPHPRRRCGAGPVE